MPADFWGHGTKDMAAFYVGKTFFCIKTFMIVTKALWNILFFYESMYAMANEKFLITWLTLTWIQFPDGLWVSDMEISSSKLACGNESLASCGLIFVGEDISIPVTWPHSEILYFSLNPH